jgi:ABC-type transport system involved in multi-copper enzyme maturation permease subunit
VKALVQAEVLKLLSTRTPVGLLLATLALVALTVAVEVPKGGEESAPVPLDDPGVLAAAVGISFGVPLVMAVLVGVLAYTQEFRYGTATSTYLAEPSRSRVLAAKWLASALASVGVTVATLALSVPLAAALIRSRNGTVAVTAQFWQTVGPEFAAMAAYGVIGVAVGALIRNQVTAVVGVLVWLLAVEQVVLVAWPTVGRWMPGGATNALLQLAPAISLDGKLLSPPVGGLVLAAYTAAAVGLALAVERRRDVL